MSLLHLPWPCAQRSPHSSVSLSLCLCSSFVPLQFLHCKGQLQCHQLHERTSKSSPLSPSLSVALSLPLPLTISLFNSIANSLVSLSAVFVFASAFPTVLNFQLLRSLFYHFFFHFSFTAFFSSLFFFFLLLLLCYAIFRGKVINETKSMAANDLFFWPVFFICFCFWLCFFFFFLRLVPHLQLVLGIGAATATSTATATATEEAFMMMTCYFYSCCSFCSPPRISFLFFLFSQFCLCFLFAVALFGFLCLGNKSSLSTSPLTVDVAALTSADNV